MVHDPEAACYLPGIPRATYVSNMPFQIIQGGGDDILMVYEYANANRVMEMKPVEVPPIDTWMGTSYGKWEGDTLVVVTLAQSPGEYKAPAGEMFENVTWLDRAGNYITNTATRHRAFQADGAEPYRLRGDDRRSDRLFTPVEDPDAAVQARRAERAAAGVPLRAVQRDAAIRRPA